VIRNFKSYLVIFLILLLLSIILGYSYYISRNIIRGPEIIVESPTNGETLDDQLIELSGYTINSSNLTVNGRKVFTDDKGNFKEKLLLSYGYNIIEIKAEDRFKRSSSKNLQLLFK
jgi:hypothetical protein